MERIPGEIVGSIDNLLTEIFLRLPIKSLIRFKRVSKHWQSLISDPGLGLRRNPIPGPAVGMFVPRCNNVTTISQYVSFSNTQPTNKLVKQLIGVEIINSCNGLLLCSSNLTKSKYYVYNPTTNKSSTFSYGGIVQSKLLGMSLAFDPDKSPHYKIVRVEGRYLDYNEYEHGFEVYSSENGCWRKPDGIFRSRVSFKKGVYWNGAIHWINEVTRDCLYFDPDDDDPMVKPRMTPAIPEPGTGRDTCYFGESCGHLNYVEFTRPNIWAHVYELRRDYSEWFVKYNVDLSIIYEALYYTKKYDDFDAFTDMWRWFFAFASTMLVRGEKDEYSFIVVIYCGKIIVRFNFVKGTCETICDMRDCEHINFTKGFQYIESLRPI